MAHKKKKTGFGQTKAGFFLGTQKFEDRPSTTKDPRRPVSKTKMIRRKK